MRAVDDYEDSEDSLRLRRQTPQARILSGAPFFDRSRIKPGTVAGPVPTLG